MTEETITVRAGEVQSLAEDTRPIARENASMSVERISVRVSSSNEQSHTSRLNNRLRGVSFNLVNTSR